MMLERILAAKRRRLAGASSGITNLPVAPRQGPGLWEALGRPWPAFILECKAASPSAGVLIEGYDPAELAGQYEGIADAVSVLTEPEFFGGDIAHLRRVREVTRVPVLRKDFILGPDEVVEARAHGADAVLLMLSVLADARWRDCYGAARELGMDAVTEVHDEAELERAIGIEAPIIGINNRDLKTLAVDLAVTERLAPQIPAGCRVVSESGIASREQIARLAPLVDGFLVGTGLSRGGRPGHTARLLAFGRVKVCGLTRPEDAAMAWRLGALMGGLIFVSDSPRRIDLDSARRVCAAAPLGWVGVFREQPLAEVAATAKLLRLAAVQLHGGEGSEYAGRLRALLPTGCEIWKAIAGRSPLPEPGDLGVDRLLLDTGRDGVLGGSGIVFAGAALAGANLSRCVLAGGINAENVLAAVRLEPWSIDVNSGVESGPGIKDEARLSALMQTLRGAAGRRRLDGDN